MKSTIIVGFIFGEDENPEGSGIYKQHIIEVSKKCNVKSSGRNISMGYDVNDDISLTETVDFVADPYILSNLGRIAYVKKRGINWCVKHIDDSKRPRLYLRLGGVYSGKTAD